MCYSFRPTYRDFTSSMKRQTNSVLCGLVCLLATTNIDAARVYKWTDADGKTYFSDKAPRAQESIDVEVKDISSDSNVVASPSSAPAASSNAPAPAAASAHSSTIEAATTEETGTENESSAPAPLGISSGSSSGSGSASADGGSAGSGGGFGLTVKPAADLVDSQPPLELEPSVSDDTSSLSDPTDGHRSDRSASQRPLINQLSTKEDSEAASDNSLASKTEAIVLFSDGFEEPFVGAKYWSHSGNSRAFRVTKPVRDGSHSLQLDLRRSYQIPYRTEIALKRRKVYVDFDVEHEYSFSLFIPDSWVSDNAPELVAQWHGVPDKSLGEDWRSPPLGLGIEENRWIIYIRWDARRLTPNKNAPGERYQGYIKYDLGEVDLNTWTDWAFRIKWSYADDGLLRIWKNGTEVISRSGSNAFNDEFAPYFKVGIYKWLWKPGKAIEGNGDVDSRTLYLDSVLVHAWE